MKKMLILQMRPENETADSEFEAILRVGKIDRDQVQRIRVEQHVNLEIDIRNYSAIIAGGSPFDVTCPADQKSSVQRHIESFFSHLFDQIMPADFPFLGACSGNGLLGKYSGTTISNKYPEPVGGVMVSVTPEGEKDDLLIGLPKQFHAFVGHKEACESVPQGAVLLVTSKTCPVQMFRIKNNIYATQFHPEADVQEFILRINIYKNHGYFPPEKADALISALKDYETPEFTNEILRRFVRKYKDIGSRYAKT
jgi:GMP synthase (glutamine-hydrolysing)